MNTLLDSIATVLLTLIAYAMLRFCVAADYMREHAGRPGQGIDPMRVFVWVWLAFTVWRIWS